MQGQRQGRLDAETIERLKGVPVLASLDEERMHCLDGSRKVTLEPGTLLVKQGELTREFFILLQGSLEVSQLNAEGHEMRMHVFEEGASFGEVPLLASVPATVNMRAMGRCEVLQLSEDQFWKLMMSCPEVRRRSWETWRCGCRRCRA